MVMRKLILGCALGSLVCTGLAAHSQSADLDKKASMVTNVLCKLSARVHVLEEKNIELERKVKGMQGAINRLFAATEKLEHEHWIGK